MSKLKKLNRIALFAALNVICAWICIPGGVPFTLQTLGVFMAAGVLGGKSGAVSVLVYLLLGATGLPVFSGGRGGFGVLLGDTGGYLIGFLPGAYVCGKLCEKKKSIGRLILSMCLGQLVCYLSGTLWAYFAYIRAGGAGIAAILIRYIMPFIVPDICKILLGAFAVNRLEKSGINKKE